MIQMRTHFPGHCPQTAITALEFVSNRGPGGCLISPRQQDLLSPRQPCLPAQIGDIYVFSCDALYHSSVLMHKNLPQVTVALTNINRSLWSRCSMPDGGVNDPITGQLTDTPTRGLPTRGLDVSRTGHLADATGDFASLVFRVFLAIY